jgi:putative PIN family toxin of toxin-antitoxin system
MNVERSRFVIDTNVIVSAALFPSSIPYQGVAYVPTHGVLLLSDVVVDEIDDVFKRPRIERYISGRRREEFFRTLIDTAVLVETRISVVACRDPKDDRFLELAVNGAADCIVSGDPDLLALHPFRGIPILTPAVFCERFR